MDEDHSNLPKLEFALRGLEKERVFVPEEKDRELLHAAQNHFRQKKDKDAAEAEPLDPLHPLDLKAVLFRKLPKVKEPKARMRPKHWHRWMPLAASVAIAALMLYFARPAAERSTADTNRDGRVDVRDALLLAERIRSGTTAAGADVNGDGTADAKDADEILARAVALEGSGS